MYRKIKTKEEKEKYQKLWEESNLLWGRSDAVMQETPDQYLLESKEEAVGIIEINPIEIGGYSNITPYYPHFYEKLALTHDITNMYEVGKLYIPEEKRLKGHLQSLFSIVHEHHETTGVPLYTSVIVEKLYVSLKKFGVELTLTDEPICYRGQFNIYPVLIDPVKTKNHPLIKRFLDRADKTSLQLTN